ncbi:hypothetical protein EU545_05105 [Candidatus Thorarchaeota archaeon]|nr:MAG: hypothetical protein EU545_05105 [Candidatus Thorarchaeota archaeon]
MSSAKKAIDSTIKRVLVYTAEIVMSVILLVIICPPLAFVVPMWLQQIALGVPATALAIDPISWFGLTGAVVVTCLLAIVAGVVSTLYLQRLLESRGSEEA